MGLLGCKQRQTTPPFQVLKCLGHESLWAWRDWDVSQLPKYEKIEKTVPTFPTFPLFSLSPTPILHLQLGRATSRSSNSAGTATSSPQQLGSSSATLALGRLGPTKMGQGPKHRGFAAGDQSEPISISVWVYTHIYIYVFFFYSFIYLFICLFIYLCLCTVGVGAQVLGYVHIAPAMRSAVYFGWEGFHYLAQGQQLTCDCRRTLHLLLAKHNISRKKCVCQIRSSSSRSYSGKSWTLGFAHMQSEIGFNSLKVKGLVLLALSQKHCWNPKNVESNLSLF